LTKALRLITKNTTLSTSDNNAITLDCEPDHSYSTNSYSAEKRPLALTKVQEKGVTFAQSVSIRKALHIHNYSDDEVQACWYDVDERKAIRNNVKFAVGLLMDGMLEEDNECHCQRGLEVHTQKGAERRLLNKCAAREAVLTEQELQWEDHVYDPAYIAMLCIDCSSSAQATAHAIGLKDQLDAIP
jgi:hypothetical protein